MMSICIARIWTPPGKNITNRHASATGSTSPTSHHWLLSIHGHNTVIDN
ncbi:MAG: hypothetical protein ACK55Z_32785 [bacterium]